MSSVIAPIVNNTNGLIVIYLNFLKKCPGSNVKYFNNGFGPHWKDQKSSSKVRLTLEFFCKLVTLVSV